MKKRFYLDTSIWMDVYEDRKGYNQEPLGDFALQLFSRLFSSKSRIIFSDFLLRELEVNYSLEKIRGMILPFEKLMIKISLSYDQKEEAKIIAKERGVPKGDSIHAILARDNSAVLVSRDKHFQLLKDICEVVKPEDII
ncbi:MAG: type II toxin-antitoxin system VapC family toxin [DPANN group archaeon]|nr:type II toxin-antitoxin system VapC family toxin [DPANN group archaeon]